MTAVVVILLIIAFSPLWANLIAKAIEQKISNQKARIIFSGIVLTWTVVVVFFEIQALANYYFYLGGIEVVVANLNTTMIWGKAFLAAVLIGNVIRARGIWNKTSTLADDSFTFMVESICIACVVAFGIFIVSALAIFITELAAFLTRSSAQ